MYLTELYDPEGNALISEIYKKIENAFSDVINPESEFYKQKYVLCTLFDPAKPTEIYSVSHGDCFHIKYEGGYKIYVGSVSTID